MSNMRQIAKLAGVSLRTVFLALHENPKISEPTREKVKAIAHKLNYMLPAQRPLIIGRGHVIGYIIHEWFSVVASHILGGAMEEANQYGFSIMVKQVPPRREWLEEAMWNLADQGISGLVLAHAYQDLLPRRLLLALRHRGIHVVLVMRRLFAEPNDAVCRNEAGYADAAAEHFAALGHRRLLGIAMSECECWARACQRRQMEIAFLDGRGGAVCSTFAAYRQLTPRPTGVIVSMDDDAFRFRALARESGWTVPGDLSIHGMGNVNRAALYPEISTIDLHAREMGAAGIRLLADRLAAGIHPTEITDFREIALPGEIIDRGSTGPAPGQVDMP